MANVTVTRKKVERKLKRKVTLPKISKLERLQKSRNNYPPRGDKRQCEQLERDTCKKKKSSMVRRS